ncbi:MAG: SGNH/GDSL hydrolase family protein [Lachnospiraceae bacterium]|nr:SGNH/GDSL hydrolase family protein [Lachnospiraceae bacterium]
MKTVLCYGDSNTYGYIPGNGMRYPKDVRWTGRLQMLLGEDYTVVEEGCNGRTTVFDDPVDGWKNGLDYLKPCLNSHKPVDIVIMMLGSNDLKDTFHNGAEDIANGAEELVKTIQTFTEEKQGYKPEIILVSPPEIGEDIASSDFYGAFYEDAVERSKEFPKYYKEVAERNGCIFFNAARYVRPSGKDSLHLTPEGHVTLADKLFEVVRDIDISH